MNMIQFAMDIVSKIRLISTNLILHEVKAASSMMFPVAGKDIKIQVGFKIDSSTNQSNFHTNIEVNSLNKDAAKRALALLRSNKFISDLRERLLENEELKENLIRITMSSSPKLIGISGLLFIFRI